MSSRCGERIVYKDANVKGSRASIVEYVVQDTEVLKAGEVPLESDPLTGLRWRSSQKHSL